MPLLIMTTRRAAVRRAPGHGDWRRGHAGRRLDAQQLLGMGGVGHRLHARQRPADRDRRAGRQQRRDSELHHVPRHEPQVPVGHRRRLRQRRRRARPGRQRGTARRGHIDRRGGNRGASRRGQGRRHRPRLRHGGRAGAARRVRNHEALTRARRQRALRHPSGRGPHARPHERAARGSEGPLRHRLRDGRDQSRTSPTWTSRSSSAPTTS